MHIQKNIRNGVIFFMVLIMILAGVFAYVKRNSIRRHFKVINDELKFDNKENIKGIFYRMDSLSFDTLKQIVPLKLIVNNGRSFNINTDILNNIPDSAAILLTVEFWGNKYLRKYKNDPLREILNGSLDKKLNKINTTLMSGNRKFYIRINPEMEILANIFPWQNKSGYVEVYRHVAMFWKSRNSKLKFVWGPSGQRGAEIFYPGDDVVDFISITLNSNVEALYTRYPAYVDLKEEIHQKFHRMRYFDKPVIVLASEKAETKLSVHDVVKSEIDTIIKYRDIAYNELLWKNRDSIIQEGKFMVGLHDPEQLLTSEPGISVEHIFIDISQVQRAELAPLLHEIFSRGHDAIVTFEPWRDKDGNSDPDVLDNIIAGKYNSVIQQIYSDVSDTNHIVYLRFAHEMEIPITRYAWQSQDPLTYIRAFRYFMQFPETFPSNVKKVWGPAGDRGSEDFYPGDDVVDYISFAAYALPDKDITDYNRQSGFKSIFRSKSSHIRFLHKPIFITEFGVKGPEEFQTGWMKEAALVLNENPQVIGVSYFNRSDIPGAWGDIKAPDWSITKNTLHQFLETLDLNNM